MIASARRLRVPSRRCRVVTSSCSRTLRFHKEEEENNPGFAKRLAALADVYVNDAFGTAQPGPRLDGRSRPHPARCLRLSDRERTRGHGEGPRRPEKAVRGDHRRGQGIDEDHRDREPRPEVDTLIIGGGMIYTFLKAQGSRSANRSSRISSSGRQGRSGKNSQRCPT